MEVRRQPFTIHQAPKNTITPEDFRRLLIRRAQVQAAAGMIASEISESSESEDDVEIDIDDAIKAINSQLTVSQTPSAAACTSGAEARIDQRVHSRTSTRRDNLTQSRKEALARSRSEEWHLHEIQRQQNYAAAAEQHADQRASLMAAAAESSLEVDRLEADVQAHNQHLAHLQARQQQLVAQKQALLDQMQQVGTGALPSVMVNNDAASASPTALVSERLVEAPPKLW